MDERPKFFLCGLNLRREGRVAIINYKVGKSHAMTQAESKKNGWKFRLTDKIARLSQISLEENIVFWPEKLKLWFYGYKSTKSYQATIWGKKVNLSLSIAPFGTPTEQLPVTPPAPKKKKRISLPPEKQAYVYLLQTKIEALEASKPPAPDEALEKRYWEYLDAQRFIGLCQQTVQVLNDPQRDDPAKCRDACEYLSEIFTLFQAMQLPDELLRDDTKFALMLAKVLQIAQGVEEKAEKLQIPVSPSLHDLIAFIDELTDRMIDGSHKLYGIARKMTPEEYDAHLDLVLSALYSDKPIEERLKLSEQIWENRLVDPDERIECLEKAIELVKKQARKKPESVPCPDKELIRRHLAAMSGFMKALEEEGETVWRMRMAESLMDSLVVWREAADRPPLTVEAFAAQIYLQSAAIETKETEKGEIAYRLELYFQDKDDSFEGHVLYAEVTDGKVTEITLMG